MSDTYLSVPVGLAECCVSRDPKEVLVAYGLGSCLGIGVYDPLARVAGLLHAMLPQQNGSRENMPAKYVDSGISHLIAEVVKKGASRDRLLFKMVGGANMLTVSDLRAAFNIGERNLATAKSMFKELTLNLQGQEVGGVLGRTMRVYVADGRMTIRVMGGQEMIIGTTRSSSAAPIPKALKEMV